MSVSLQLNYVTQNETARKAIKSYMGFLEKAFEQYRDLWEDYMKLQEKHEQCSVLSPFQMTIDEPSVKTKDELTLQKQLNSDVILPESNVSLLELDSLDTGGHKFSDVDIETDFANQSEDFLYSSPSKSPVFSKRCPKVNSTFAKKLMQSPEAAASSVYNESTADTKMYRKDKKVPSKSNQKLEISTTYHVETTFLSNGKKLKQSRLMFPLKSDKKIPSLDASELNLTMHKKNTMHKADTMHKAKQDSTDTLVVKAPIIIEDNATRTNETFFEDVMEISPTQKNVQSKSRHCLKLNRKVSKQTMKNSPNKKKHYHLGSNLATKAEIDDADFNLYLSPEHISTNMIYNKSVAKSSNRIVKAFMHNVNTCNPSLTHKYNEADVKSTITIDNERKDQTVKDEMQNISQNLGDLYEEETFYLPAEQTASKNDTDHFNLDNTENKPSKKKLSEKLNKYLIWPTEKENVSEQLNMRRKVDRAKLNGWDCWECAEYYKNLSLSKEELQERKNQCSRHRHKYERPTTPEGFWDPGFPETPSCTYRYNMK